MATTKAVERARGTAAVSEAMEALAREKELREQFRAKTWTASEVRALTSKLAEQQDRTALQVLNDEITLAKQENRFRDDLTPTRENLRVRHGSAAWLISRAEIPLLMQLATELDREGGIQASAPQSHYNAAMTWLKTLLNEGRVVTTETTLGLIAREALPRWATNPAANAWLSRATTPEEVQLRDAQTSRWEALEEGWREVLGAVRMGVEPPPACAGISWAPIASPEQFSEVREGFERDTREALKGSNQRAREEAKRLYHQSVQDAVGQMSARHRQALEEGGIRPPSESQNGGELKPKGGGLDRWTEREVERMRAEREAGGEG